jgi:hypothetical protein
MLQKRTSELPTQFLGYPLKTTQPETVIQIKR